LKVLVAPLDWGLGHATRCVPLIHAMLQMKWEVTLAGEGQSLHVLTQEFPQLPVLSLKGYRISYPKKGFLFIPTLLFQVPKLFKTISLEKKWLEEKQKEYRWDFVISDNRYGLSNHNTTCIFITHQLYVISGWGKIIDGIVNKKLHQWISKFNQCWIPDQEEDGGIAGKLSHPSTLHPVPYTLSPSPYSLSPVPYSLFPSPLKYLGPLSRLTPKQTESQDKILILLSGPEPQRSLLEEKILEQIKTINEQFLVVRGLPTNTAKPVSTTTVQFENHLSSEALSAALSNAKLVICRSGYSSIMDLLKFKKRAILIPTPGQTEQLYLGKLLKERNWFYVTQQHNFQLAEAIPECMVSLYEAPTLNFDLHKQVLAELVTQ
jgi:UDP-N-acetylglucosamine transferase subunit ALG13